MSSLGIAVGASQEQPKLPVPKLSETLDKFVRYARVHLSEEEHRQLAEAAQDLLQSELGEKLQKLLEQRAVDEPTSWLLSWWTEQAYLAYPDSLPIWSNFYCQFTPTSPIPEVCRPLFRQLAPRLGAQAVRTAIWTMELMRERDDILHDRVPAKPPVCRRLLNNAFGSCRVPGLPHDLIKRSAEVQREADFVVVLRHDRYFIVRHLARPSTSFLSVAEAYQAIIDTADASDRDCGHAVDPFPVGLLTAGDRQMWAGVYPQLRRQSEANDRLLTALEDCAFVVCLDAVEPRDLHDSDAILFHNRGRNRWFDKPIQLISFPSGNGGTNCEHAGWDGTVAVPIFERMLANESRYVSLPSSSPTTGLPFEGPLGFQLGGEALGEAVAVGVAETLPSFALENHSTAVCRAFGKDLLKAARVSPDAFCQIAFQVAYHRVFGKFVPTYESASTRKFQWGRTETLRPVTEQSTHFAQAFNQPEERRASHAELLQLLQAASKEHSRRVAESSSEAKACDRHLFGFRQLLKTTKDATPRLFAHPAFSRVSHWQMSTSNISNDYFEVGWGAVVPDGFGVCYCIRENLIAVKVSAQPHAGTSAQVFAAAILSAFHDLGAFLSKPLAKL